MFRTLLCAALVVLSCSAAALAQEAQRLTAAEEYGKAFPVVKVQPDGLLVCEAEEFQPTAPGWTPRPWGENYYSATLANTFLSRQGFLAAGEQTAGASSERQVEIPAAGRYAVLVRYEAAYRFETQFRVQVEQGGRKVVDRLYGARDNLKIWAFRQKLQKEVGWDWGACENVVWEGHDVLADLQPGRAAIRLIAEKQPEPAAKRHIDLVLLTTKLDDIQNRLEKENYLPLDGLLTQSGDLYVRAKNLAADPLTLRPTGVAGGYGTDHSPYWVHLRNWGAAQPLEVAPGQQSAWNEMGSWVDSLNDGQLTLGAAGKSLKYELEFATPDGKGGFQMIGKYAGNQAAPPLAYFGDTRYARRVIHQADVLYELLAYLKQQKIPGRAPVQTPIYGYTFEPLAGDAQHAAAVAEFRQLFSLSGTNTEPPLPGLTGPRGYIDVRSVPTDKLAEFCKALGDKAREVRVVSLGDEIALPTPRGPQVNDQFKAWLQTQGVTPANLFRGQTPGEVQFDVSPAAKQNAPGLYYWSHRYQNAYGVKEMKVRTDLLRAHLPSAQIGANYSPHHGGPAYTYLGESFKWTNCFRQEGMTLPWGEDYIFQVPVCSQQVNGLGLDLFRAGNKGRPEREIMYYVMPHWPGNHPDSWRRLFFNALQHGATMINLFEFRPVQVAYTENYVNHPAMYAAVLRGFRELGQFDDIVAQGQVRPGVAALWMSEAGDIWHDNDGAFAAAKRGLYTAILHQQLPLDLVVEEDALDGALGKYQTLYLTDRHVSLAASQAIARWVAGGGKLLATAGAGMRDELDQPNLVLQELLGVSETKLETPDSGRLNYLKQDLPFQTPLAKVRGLAEGVETPVFSVRSRLVLKGGQATAQFTDDGSPAVVTRTVGRGQTTACAFLPSLSYYYPALPKRPVERTSAGDSLTHFVPHAFDAAAGKVIGSVAPPAEKLPVTCSEPLVEARLIESPAGAALLLVNWSGKAQPGLKVTVRSGPPSKTVALASGGKVGVKPASGAIELELDLSVAETVIFR